jgi:hypothetical protein
LSRKRNAEIKVETAKITRGIPARYDARVRRWWRNTLVVVSLTLLVGTTFIWIASYFRYTKLFLPAQAGSRNWGVSCYRGSITFHTIDSGPPAHGIIFEANPESDVTAIMWDNYMRRESWMGFALRQTKTAYTTPTAPHLHDQLIVPIGILSVLAILPLLAIRRLNRSLQRESSGCCVHCGYDLRATPERCPECGVATASRGCRSPEQSTEPPGVR